jgi:hypothetical protein
LEALHLAPDAALSLFQPFRARNWRDRPTRIVIDFDAAWLGTKGSRLFRYDLSIVHGPRSGERVGHEALSVRDGGASERSSGATTMVSDARRSSGYAMAIPASRAVRRNASVIATLAALNHTLLEAAWNDIQGMQRNIRGLAITRYDVRSALRYIHDAPGAREAFVREMRRLDLGLVDVKIEPGPNGLMATFEHEGLDAPVMLEEESEGTRHLLALFPALFFTLETGRPALMDEFDVSLHPLLVPEVLRWFHDPRRNEGRAQLFLAAHNPAIFDYLQKEEILLVDKGPDGASVVTSLRDVQGLRREPSLARKYLGGVFGGRAERGLGGGAEASARSAARARFPGGRGRIRGCVRRLAERPLRRREASPPPRRAAARGRRPAGSH